MLNKIIMPLTTLILLTGCVSLNLHEIREPERKVFELINDFRASNGLPRLKYLKHRQWQVDLWARHISQRFEHARTGYTCENIAYNYESPEELYYQWKNSPGHKRNILLRRVKYCVIGIYSDGRRYFGVFRGFEKEKLKREGL
jgi:uncharacterized protein YkwD